MELTETQMENQIQKIDKLMEKKRDRKGHNDKKKRDRESKDHEKDQRSNDFSMESIKPLGNLSSEGKEDEMSVT